MGAEPDDGGLDQIRNYDIAMDKKDTISTTVALSRSLDSFITGIADVEKHIGRDFVFHDAEEDSVHIDRNGTVKVRLWTSSDMNYGKHFHVDFTLSGCMEIRAINYYPSDCYVYEMRLEVSELTPDITTVIFDGVGLEFSCRKIAIIVSECPVERKV